MSYLSQFTTNNDYGNRFYIELSVLKTLKNCLTLKKHISYDSKSLSLQNNIGCIRFNINNLKMLFMKACRYDKNVLFKMKNEINFKGQLLVTIMI